MHTGELARRDRRRTCSAAAGCSARTTSAAYRPVVRPSLTTQRRRLDAGHHAAAVGGRRRAWPRCCGCSTAGRTATGRRGTSSTWCGCSARCSATGSTCWTTPTTSSGTRRPSSRWSTPTTRQVLESGSTAHVSVTDGDGAACSVTVSSGYGAGMIAARHRDLAQQLPRRAGAQPARAARPARPARGCCPTWRRRSAGTRDGLGAGDRLARRRPDHHRGRAGAGRLRRRAAAWPEAVHHPRVHVHRAGRPDEVVRRESELSMYFGGVGAALTRPDGHLVGGSRPASRRRGAPGASQRDREPRQHQLGQRADRQRVEHRAEAEHAAEQQAEDHDGHLEAGAHQPQRPAGTPGQAGHQAVARAAAELAADVERGGQPVARRRRRPAGSRAATSASGVVEQPRGSRRRPGRRRARWRRCRGRAPRAAGSRQQHHEAHHHDDLAEADRQEPGEPGVQHVPRRQAEVGRGPSSPGTRRTAPGRRSSCGSRRRQPAGAQLGDRAEVGQAGPGGGRGGGRGHAVQSAANWPCAEMANRGTVACMTRSIAASRVATLVGDFDRSPAYAGLADALRLLIGDGRIALGHPAAQRARAHRRARRLADHGHPGVRRAARRRVRRGPAGRRHLHPGARRPGPRPRPGPAPPARRRRRDRPQLRGRLRAARARRGVRRRGGRAAGVPRRARLLPGRPPRSSRQAIAATYDARGLPTDPEQIMVTPGALSAASIVAQALTGPGDRVLVESPVYPNATQAIRHGGARITGSPVDPDGLGPRRRRRRAAADLAAAGLPDPRLPEPDRAPDDRRAARGVRRPPAAHPHGRGGRRGAPGAGARGAGDAAAVRGVRHRHDHHRQRQQVVLGRPAARLDPRAARPDGARSPRPGSASTSAPRCSSSWC